MARRCASSAWPPTGYSQDAQSGERRELTDFHDVVVWNQGTRKLAELCELYLQKGRLVYVEGRLQTRSWDDPQSGQKRYRTKIIAGDVQFLDGRQDGAQESASTVAPVVARAAAQAVDPDDIPF